MPRLNLKTLHQLYQLVSVRKETPMTIKVKSFYFPSRVWLFSPDKLAHHRVFLASLLSQLPEGYLQSVSDGGLPWFSAIRLRNGSQWGGLDDADKLLAMARAASMVKTHFPLEVCDVPFCRLMDEDIRLAEHHLPPDKQNQSMLYWRFRLNV